MIQKEPYDYPIAGKTCKGYLTYDNDTKEKRPAVILAHAWMGQNPFIREKAEQIASLGYLGLAVDLFGEGKTTADHLEAREMITPFVQDRQLIRDHMNSVVEKLRNHPLVDSERIAAIGYCFGGVCALELAKSGADIKGVVSFHGVLGNPHSIKQKPIETALQIPASILILHGYKDSMVPEEDLLAFEKEMSRKGADWQVHVYGEAMHAFTNPSAQMPEISLQYHEKSARRSWQAMENFLSEIFS
ncbi:MAG: Carboxymethylenebutenolidase [Chlamydiae bacterium]|nr:Carboxymethylenebutenolidase [Chlamydiota bacterium]